MQKKKTKPLYRILDWKQYNIALVKRGSLTICMDQDSRNPWLNQALTRRRGASNTYSDPAIFCRLTIQSVYSLPLRATRGLIQSIADMPGLDLLIPDYSTLSRRRVGLHLELPRRRKKEPLHLVVDSTGMKVYGEGEWLVRQHGYKKRRTWRKLHIGMDESTGELLAAVMSISQMSGKGVLPDLLEQVDEEIKRVSAGGGYDYMSCYGAIDNRKARATMPPGRTARIWNNGQMDQRDKHVRRIRKAGRKKWKQETGYRRGSLAETGMMRMKAIFGGRLSARRFEGQASEVFIR